MQPDISRPFIRPGDAPSYKQSRKITMEESISKEQFQAIVKAALLAGVTAESISNEFGLSRSAVGRWAEGRTAPQPQIRPHVVAKITDLQAKLPPR